MRMTASELACSWIMLGGLLRCGRHHRPQLSFEKPIARDMAEHAQHMAFIMLDHVLGRVGFSRTRGPVGCLRGWWPMSTAPLCCRSSCRCSMASSAAVGPQHEFPRKTKATAGSRSVRAQDADTGMRRPDIPDLPMTGPMP